MADKDQDQMPLGPPPGDKGLTNAGGNVEPDEESETEPFRTSLENVDGAVSRCNKAYLFSVTIPLDKVTRHVVSMDVLLTHLKIDSGLWIYPSMSGMEAHSVPRDAGGEMILRLRNGPGPSVSQMGVVGGICDEDPFVLRIASLQAQKATACAGHWVVKRERREAESVALVLEVRPSLPSGLLAPLEWGDAVVNIRLLIGREP